MSFAGQKITWEEYQARKSQHNETMLLLFDHRLNAEIIPDRSYGNVQAHRFFVGQQLTRDWQASGPLPNMPNPFLTPRPSDSRNGTSRQSSQAPVQSPRGLPLTSPRHTSGGRAVSLPVPEDFSATPSVEQSSPRRLRQGSVGHATPRTTGSTLHTPRLTPRSEKPRSASQSVGLGLHNSFFEARVDREVSIFDSVINGVKETAIFKKSDSKGWIRDMEKRNSYLEKYCKKLEHENNQILLQTLHC